MLFHAVCSKWNQKLTLSLTANNIDEARNALHAQGYSIMDIQQIAEEKVIDSNFFYFDLNVNGQMKTGKIQSDDIFKAYRKLVEDLNYDVVYIYTTEGMAEDQKKVITARVKDWYVLYKQSLGIDDLKTKKLTEHEEDTIGISPQVLKEIQNYNNALDGTIEKIQNLFLKYHNTITADQKRELEGLQAQLIQTKGSSNLWKLKNVVEHALTMIGQIEAEFIKTGVNTEKQKLIEQTNSLLKQIGSSERVAQQKGDDDIGVMIGKFFDKLQKRSEEKKLQEKTQQETKKQKVDTSSFVYYKNLRELNIYKQNLSTTSNQLVKAILSFKFQLAKRLWLKRKLLQQNISIIENRIHNRNISYTKVVKGITYYFDITLLVFQQIFDVFFYSLYIYTISYVLLKSLKNLGILESLRFDEHFFHYICLVSILTFCLSFFRTLLGIMIMGSCFVFLFTFISINF